MSIFDETNGTYSLVTRDRMLDLFTNRHELIRRFAGYLNDDPPSKRILFLYGMGGNGKSLLLRYFETRCCFRLAPEQWREISSYPDEAFCEALANAPSAKAVPVARIDLGARPAGESRPQEAFSALFMLKRQLARFKLTFPRFDFAAITYLHKSGLEINKLLEGLFPQSELGIATDIADCLINLPVLRTGLELYQILDQRLDAVFSRRRFERRVPGSTAAQILSLSPEPDLATELPRYFAEDLNDALAPIGKLERLVLLFDTHEAFYGEGVAGSDSLAYTDYTARDEWLRYLLGHLNLSGGVVAVAAGRIRPPWESVSRAQLPQRFVDYQPVDCLPAADAREYLERAGISDDQLRSLLIDYSSVSDCEVHPYFLGLCADLVLAAAERGSSIDPAFFRSSDEAADRERALASRLLSWVKPEMEYTIVAMSACRSFDLQTFLHLARQLGFAQHRLEFDRLIAFSFVSPVSVAGTERRRQAYEVHRLLRRALRRAKPDAIRQAHELLRVWYADHALAGDFTARMEEIYHTNQLDPSNGVSAWVDAMDRCLARSRYDRCRSMIALLHDLNVETEFDRGRCMYRVARADLGLGDWAEAEAILQGLPADSPHWLLLQAELAFCRGEFDTAAASARSAMEAVQGSARLPFAFRLAEIELYRGMFPEARRLIASAIQLAQADEDVNQVCRWQNLLGEIEFFSGNVEAAKEQFEQARQQLERLPDGQRDNVVRANIVQNIGLVAEALGDWSAALAAHQSALEIRRQTGDARGAACSLHGMGKAYLGLRDLEQAERLLGEAARAAGQLGEGLLLAKITHSRADLASARSDHAKGERLAREALEAFRRHSTPYDIAAALLTLSRLRGLQGDLTGQMAAIDQARQLIDPGRFLVLYRLFPEAAMPPPARVRAGALAYAAGDALGVPWEGRPASEISREAIDQLPARGGWPAGSTSDDTAQLLLVGRYLSERGAAADEREFLSRLAEAFPEMRGAGPTTTAAVERFRATGDLLAAAGETNGAAMRALPIGWAIPVAASKRRRELTIRLSRTTHGSVGAIGSACLVAAMASWAIEACPLGSIINAAIDEITWLEGLFPGSSSVFQPVREAASGAWTPSGARVTMDAVTTLAAVIHVLRHVERKGLELADALRYAVSLGGDTDTVTAIVGGILGCRMGDVAGIPWLSRVALPESAMLDAVSTALSRLRRSFYA